MTKRILTIVKVLCLLLVLLTMLSCNEKEQTVQSESDSNVSETQSANQFRFGLSANRIGNTNMYEVYYSGAVSVDFFRRAEGEKAIKRLIAMELVKDEVYENSEDYLNEEKLKELVERSQSEDIWDADNIPIVILVDGN